MADYTGDQSNPDEVVPGSTPLLDYDPWQIASARDIFAEAKADLDQLIARCETMSGPAKWAGDPVSATAEERLGHLKEDCIGVLQAYSTQLGTAVQVFEKTMKWYQTTDEGKARAMRAVGSPVDALRTTNI